jgi:sugar phosphate isomerase/epimerase
MKLSCATLGFANDAPLEVSLGRISKAGFKAVDIFAWRPHLHPTDYTKEMRKKVKEMAAELGMKVSGLSVQGGRFGMQFNFCYPWKVARDDVVSYYKDCIEVASDLGAEAINVLLVTSCMERHLNRHGNGQRSAFLSWLNWLKSVM